MVKALPKSVAKVKSLAGLSISKAVEQGAKEGLPVIGPKTVNGSYMAFLSSLFGWAVKEQWLQANPVSGLTVTDTVDAADKRDPFREAQLASIFATAPWSPRDAAPRGKPMHFWGPLLAPFHSIRRGEIAQLDVADVCEVDGVMVMLIRPGQDGQRVKTKAGRRRCSRYLAGQHQAGLRSAPGGAVELPLS